MISVKQEMTQRVAFVFEDTPISEVYASMQALGVHHVPVVRSGKLVGMLSDRDLLAHARFTRKEVTLPNRKAGEIMSQPVVTCFANTSIGNVADLMLKHKIHGIPVVTQDGSLQGIITSADLIRVLSSRVWELSDSVPMQFEPPSHLLEISN